MKEILTQENTEPQFQANTSHKSKTVIKKLIKKYEDAIFSFFRELGLPLNLREIVRAYILASGGNTSFEASYNELTDLLYKRSATRLQSNRETIRYKAKALQQWQKKHHVELIRVIEKGRKISRPDGNDEYLKTKYEFVLLDEIVRVLYEYPANELKARIEEAVARMKQNYVPEESKKEIPAFYMLQRNSRTIFTKLGKVYDQAEQVNLDPIKYCQHLISQLQDSLAEIAEQRAEKHNRERRISDFLAATNETNTDSYENRGVENHHINLLENSDGNIPSDNRMVALSYGSISNHTNVFLNSSVKNEGNNNLLDAALHYAKAGYAVFPLQNLVIKNDFVRCSCRDWQTCEKQGKHPRTYHGLKDATTNLETIKFWWRKWPNANIGLLTGKQSGIFVLDVDPKAGGGYSLSELQDSYGMLPATLTAITGSGGRHLIFNYPLDVRLKNSASLIARGLDVKSDNGYIVAAPSLHKSGKRYYWHGINTPVLDAPDWLVALILFAEEEAEKNEQANNKSASDSSLPLVSTEPIKEGEGRNTYLYRQACGLVMSYSPEEVKKRLQAKNLARCVPPLDDAELARILKSAETRRPEKVKLAA